MYVCTCHVHVLVWLPRTQNQTHLLDCWLNRPPHSFCSLFYGTGESGFCSFGTSIAMALLEMMFSEVENHEGPVTYTQEASTILTHYCICIHETNLECVYEVYKIVY